MAEKKLTVVITSDTAQARKGIADLNNALGSTESKAESSASGLKTALGGLAIGAFVLDGVRALGEVERINAQTSAALKSTGAEAWITADAVEGLAGSIEKKTGIEAEAIQSGQNLLLTFTNVQNAAGEGNDIFDQATQTMADMSTAMGTDATTSAMQLGKALNDPIKGISALSKVGVTFTADQKAMVAEMVAAGDTMGAQKVILAELNKEFGGSAEAFGETLPGQIAKAKNSLGDMQESILVGAVPALKMGASAVGGLADAYAALPPSVQTVTTLAAVGAGVWVKFGDSISAFGGQAAAAGKKGADLARTLSQGLDGVAATRGITKTQAATEMLKSSMDGALGPTGRFSQKISGLSTAAVGGGAAFVGFGAILYAWQDEQAKASKRAADLQSAIKGIAEESMRTGRTVEDVFTTSTLPDFIGDNAKAFEDTGVNIAELNEALVAGGQEWRSYAQAQIAAAGGMDTAKGRELVAAFQKLEGILPGARTATEQQAKANSDLGLTIDPLTGKTIALGEAMSGATESFAGMGDSVRGIGEKFGEIPGAAEAARQAISSFYDEITGNLSAQIEAEASLDSLAASFAANGISMDVNSEQGRTNASALIAVKDAAAGAAVEILNQGGSSTEAAAVMQGYVTRLNETQAAAGFSEAEIAYMNATMGLTPTDIQTIIQSNAPAVTGDVDTLNRKITTLPNGHVIVTADTSRAHSALDALASRISALGATLSANLSQIALSASGRAKGGPVEKGELYLVGEEGPELAMFGQNGQVIDAATTAALLGQSGAGGMKRGGFGGASDGASWSTTSGSGFGAMGGGRAPGRLSLVGEARLYQAGKDLIAGLVRGITDSIPSVSGVLGTVTDMIPDWKGPAARDAKLLEPAGRLIMDGLVTGINDGIPNLQARLDFISALVATQARANVDAFWAAQSRINSQMAGAQQNEDGSWSQSWMGTPQQESEMTKWLAALRRFFNGGTDPVTPNPSASGRSGTDGMSKAAAEVTRMQGETTATVTDFSNVLDRLNWIMDSVSKTMTLAEARAAVFAATAQQAARGADALARWNEALTRFFAGGAGAQVPMQAATPTGPVPAPSQAPGRGRSSAGGGNVYVNIHPNAVRGDGDIRQIVDGINRLQRGQTRPVFPAGVAG